MNAAFNLLLERKGVHYISWMFFFSFARWWDFALQCVLSIWLRNRFGVNPTVCFIDLGKLNLLKISLSWSKSVKQTVWKGLGNNFSRNYLGKGELTLAGSTVSAIGPTGVHRTSGGHRDQASRRSPLFQDIS